MLCLRGVFTLLFFVKTVRVLENGLARTPPMGWMSWGYYMCGTDCEKQPDRCLDENLILSVADAFFHEGYQEAGYEYIIIDDCWSEATRDSDGKLVADRQRFPKGMKYIADYIHSRGLKFGMYTNIAHVTCMYFPGSKSHFDVDAQSFADWGVDYLKVDGCYVEEPELNTGYIELGHHLNRTGRPMVYSCSWPYYIEHKHKHKFNYSLIVPHCNLWRNYHDVMPKWEAVKYIIQFYEAEYKNLHQYHGPGSWNDPDMLIIGTGVLTPGQSRIQMAVYAMLSAPLLISTDMKRITKEERGLLQNLDLLSIAQDPLGVMAKPYKFPNGVTLWVKHHLPIKGNIYYSYTFALVNFEGQSRYVSFYPKDYGLNSSDAYTILDVFTGIYVKNISLDNILEIQLPPQDVILFSVYPL